MSKVDELLESICALTLVEAYELVKAIEEKFEVTAAAPVAAVAAAGPGRWRRRRGGRGEDELRRRPHRRR